MKTEEYFISSLKPFPNNSLPLLVYRKATGTRRPEPEWFERIFGANGWTGSWRNGIFTFHHFHAEAHEVLGCYSGNATVIFGGPEGIEAGIEAGDAVLIPAGLGHCLKRSSTDFHVVGAYPTGTYADLRRGSPDEFNNMQARIRVVPLPAEDPVGGSDGAVQRFWYQS